MRVAALYDIHGNLPALEAVLRDIVAAHVDQIIIGGDVVAGPMPTETLDCLLSQTIPVHFIRGNADREIAAQMIGQEIGDLPAHVREIVVWVADQLKPQHQQRIDNWPATLNLMVSGVGPVLFCHATPRNDTDVFTRLTPEARLLPLFAGLDAALVVCGHTHMQFDRQVGNVRVLNAGSVGMPYGEPGAYWLLLGPTPELRCTHYDSAQAAARIHATAYPQARYFADTNVVHPPSEAEALAVFTRMEIWS